MKIKPLILSLFFISIIYLIGSYSWDKILNDSICPSQMIIPFFKYFFHNYIKKSNEFSDIKFLYNIFIKIPTLKSLSYLPVNGGPKFITIYKFMGIFNCIIISLLLIPNYYFQILGLSISLIFTLTFSLNLMDIKNISLLKLSYPIYINIIFTFISLFYLFLF